MAAPIRELTACPSRARTPASPPQQLPDSGYSGTSELEHPADMPDPPEETLWWERRTSGLPAGLTDTLSVYRHPFPGPQALCPEVAVVGKGRGYRSVRFRPSQLCDLAPPGLCFLTHTMGTIAAVLPSTVMEMGREDSEHLACDTEHPTC